MTASQTAVDQEQKPARNTRLPSKRTLYLLFLISLVIVYWIFVWRMERISLTPAEMPLPLLQQLPPWVVNFAGIFLPRVLRHFIPLVLGWLLAFNIATTLVFLLYDLPDHATARSFLRRLRDPRRGGGTAISVSPETLEALRTDSARLRVGGPGRISIPAGHAAVSELNGRFYRVIGAGSHALDRFEYLHSIYDLRPQDRTDPELILHSREGLEFETSVSVTYRITAPEMGMSAQQPYPYDAETIRKLAYEQMNLPGGQTSDWENLALTTVESILANTAASFSLNELLQDEQTEMGAHLTIRRNVEREARSRLREQGIDLIRLRIGGFQFPDDVTELYIQYWRSHWDNQARLTRADGEAIALEEMEIVRAEAEIELVKAITDAMQQARQQGFQGATSEMVALRFIETLGNLARESGSEIALPDQLLPQIQNLQRQLQHAKTTDSVIDGEVTSDSVNEQDPVD